MISFEQHRENLSKRQKLIEELRAEGNSENPNIVKAEAAAAEIRALESIIKEGDRLYASMYRASGEATPATGDSTNPDYSAITHYMRTGDNFELRAMTSGITGSGDTGGYLIPESWENQIIEKEKELFVMRQLADVQVSDTDRNIPIADELGVSGWIDEGTAYPESDAEFSKIVMEAHKVGRICKVSEELLQDNAFNLENWLTDTFAHSNGYTMEESFFNGDGEKKPQGFLVNAQTVEAEDDQLTYDDILNLYESLKDGYARNGTFLMNRRTLVAIMKLKDSAGNYLYKPFDPKDSTSPIGYILGRPVVLSEFMPDIAAGAKPIAFGDFKKYRIHDRTGFTIQRLIEKFADNGFIGFRGMQRTDGKLLIPEAIQVITMPTAP